MRRTDTDIYALLRKETWIMKDNRKPMIIKGMKWDYLDLMDVFYNVEVQVEYDGVDIYVLVSRVEDSEIIIVDDQTIMERWLDSECSTEEFKSTALFFKHYDWQYETGEEYTESDIKNEVNNLIEASEYKNAIKLARFAVERYEAQYPYGIVQRHNAGDFDISAKEMLATLSFQNNNLNTEQGDSIPLPSYATVDEIDLLDGIDWEDKEDIYMHRFSMEASILYPHVYDVFADVTKEDKKRALSHLQAKCNSEDDYQNWKADFLKEAKDKLEMKKVKILACDYLFAGIGSYTAMIPEEQLPGFKCWINENGSAFFGEARPAEEKEIEAFIALNASKIASENFNGFGSDEEE